MSALVPLELIRVLNWVGVGPGGMRTEGLGTGLDNRNTRQRIYIFVPVCVQEPEAEDFRPTRPPRRVEAPRSEGITRRQTQSWQETGEYRRYLESLSHSTYDQMNRDLTRKVDRAYKPSINTLKILAFRQNPGEVHHQAARHSPQTLPSSDSQRFQKFSFTTEALSKAISKVGIECLMNQRTPNYWNEMKMNE